MDLISKATGFSKWTKDEKIQWLMTNHFDNDNQAKKTLSQYWYDDVKLQKLHDEFTENTISNFVLPYSVAPNFVINGKQYTVPMVIEESSVVAAASLVAKFWANKGGFKTTVLDTQKIGQVHFMYQGDKNELQSYFETKKEALLEAVADITANMRKRGGGIRNIELRDKTADLANYYQLHVTFETVDSMGANFINSCLEAIAKAFKKEDINIVMSILSNYVPQCVVRAEVSCKVSELYEDNAAHYAQKFKQALDIANAEVHRAVTHNKGIMNGIDAIVLATGNDFRAVEAGAHAYAARSGKYQSLSGCEIKDGIFKFWLELPLALGTVGGLTKIHPMAKFSLDLLDRPSAKELMQIVAAVGLSQNFAALRALTTTGIQHGHMKMHLKNILTQLQANDNEKETLVTYFKDRTVSHAAVATAYEALKNGTL